MDITSSRKYSGKTAGQIVLEVVRSAIRRRMILDAVTPFYIFRTDNQQVLAKGVMGYDAAKDKSNEIRKRYGLKWDQVSFKSEKGRSAQSVDTRNKKSSRGVEYASNFNPSKGRRFSGYYDRQGNWADLD